MLDLLVRGGTVYPGDDPPMRADVGVVDGRIAFVRAAGEDQAAQASIDASGCAVCPGFIDMHAHSALRPFTHPLLEPKIAQGFTTELIGLDGLGPAPVARDRVGERRTYLLGLEGSGPEVWDWTTFAGYLEALERARPATNLVACVGHNSVRDHVMGSVRRAPSAAEIDAMRGEIRLAFEAGARALSFGLVYLPGVFSDTSELVAVAQAAAAFAAPLIPHVRNESTRVLEAHGEFLDVARRSGAPLHLSHLKVVGGDPATVDELLGLLDTARAELQVTFDQYPYGAGSTVLGSLLPPWAQEGGPSDLLARLADAGERDRMRMSMTEDRTWENIYAAVGPESIVLANAAGDSARHVGQSISTIASERGTDPIDAVFDVLVETGLDATRIDHYAPESVVRTIFSHPAATVGSDGIFSERPHPRLYATAARVLGRYAHRERLVSVEEAVTRLTARPADVLGLSDRGRLLPGRRADLAIVDLARFIDTATFDAPLSHPEGMRAVVVGGTSVWRDGAATGARPGTVTRSPRGA